MKSTDPLSLSTRNFKLENNSDGAKSLVSQVQNVKDILSSKKHELAKSEMLGTRNCPQEENNGCDIRTHTVEVQVHQVNGYTDEVKSTSLLQQNLEHSTRNNLVNGEKVLNHEKSSTNCGRDAVIHGGLGHKDQKDSVLSSNLKKDGAKVNGSNRDSAVFDDIDLNVSDKGVDYSEEVNNHEIESDQSRLSMVKSKPTLVLANGVSSINGGDKDLQDTSRRNQGMKSVGDSLPLKQETGSIFSAVAIKDSLKSVNRLGLNGSGDNLQNGVTSSGNALLKNGISMGISKCSNSGVHLNRASSLESISDSGSRFERDSEIRRSKSSMNGLCSVRSRSDIELDDLMLPDGEQNNEGYDNLQVDSGVESAASSWDRMAEVKESAHARLQEELRRAYHKLKLKDEEVSRLSRIRDEVEAELEELTASLFQEAHNMVREANVQQAAAEKALKESQMQVDVLTAEVAALKTLVLTSTPSRPNPHLHPQIDPKSKDDANSNGSSIFRKQHRRSPSHFNLKYGRENSPPDSPAKEANVSQNTADMTDGSDTLEVDPNIHREFLAWKQKLSLDADDPFLARIFREDVDSCLEFNNRLLAERVREAITNESICIEAVSEKSRSQFPKKCALLETSRQCHYRMRFDGSEQTYCISQLCRNRITAVCNFLNYLRYIQRGLVKSSVHEMYWEIARLRKEISLARLGLTSTQ